MHLASYKLYSNCSWDRPRNGNQFCSKLKLSCVLFQVIGVISVFFIVVSIVSFCLKTQPDMRVPLIRNVTVMTANRTLAWTLDKYQVKIQCHSVIVTQHYSVIPI